MSIINSDLTPVPERISSSLSTDEFVESLYNYVSVRLDVNSSSNPDSWTNLVISVAVYTASTNLDFALYNTYTASTVTYPDTNVILANFNFTQLAAVSFAAVQYQVSVSGIIPSAGGSFGCTQDGVLFMKTYDTTASRHLPSASYTGVLTVNDAPTPVATRKLTVYVMNSDGSSTLTGATIRVAQTSGTKPWQTLAATSRHIDGSAFAGAVFDIKNGVTYNANGEKEEYAFLPVPIVDGDSDLSVNLVYSQPTLQLQLRVSDASLYIHENCFTQEAADDTAWRNGQYYYMFMSHVHLDSMSVRVNGRTRFEPCWLDGDYYSNSGGNFTIIETTAPLVNLLPGYTSACTFDLKFTVSRPGYIPKDIIVQNISRLMSIVGSTVVELSPNYSYSKWADSASTIMFREEGKLMTYENLSYIFMDMVNYGKAYNTPIYQQVANWSPELFCSNLQGYGPLDYLDIYTPEHCIAYHLASGGTYPDEYSTQPFIGLYNGDPYRYAMLDSFAEAQTGSYTKVQPVASLFESGLNCLYPYTYTEDEEWGPDGPDPGTGQRNRVLRIDRTLLPKPVKTGMAINLNDGQWVISGTTAGKTTYMSKTGYHIGNSSACCYIDMDYVSSITLKVCTTGEPGYDFVVASELDKTPTRSEDTGGTTGNYWSGYGEADGDFHTVTFNNIPGGHHRITIAYMKDDSVDEEPDCGMFYIDDVTYY